MKKINNNFKLALILGLGSLTSSPQIVFSQTKQSQLVCRAKAKEAAKSAYDQCLSLAKEDEAENIRKEYKAKFTKLKEYYEQKLKKLNLKAKTEAKATTSKTPTETSGVLPQKTSRPSTDIESNTSNFTPPLPVNTRDEVIQSQTVPSSVNEVAPVDSSSEPTIRLKEVTPKSERNERLESEPDLSI